MTPGAVRIAKARAAARLSQAEAAATVHVDLRTWQRWEAGDRAMHAAFFELFLLKTKQVALKRVMAG
ncbi:helix-turn-helix domain-containing protein [Dyella sp. EPa41]|uniref:helix-turn-helix domain-containing protein n=1 Tax=Dyella sp. EPa41 TaxID=1561194 RepID=UPI001916727C|nr:helix-turn-helix domain-containing protein [Dyella sp. EPa41]